MTPFVGFIPRCERHEVLLRLTSALLVAIGPDKAAFIHISGAGRKFVAETIERLRAEYGRRIEFGRSLDGHDIAIAVPVFEMGAAMLERFRLDIEDILGREVEKIYLHPDVFGAYCCETLGRTPMEPVRLQKVA